MLGRMQVAEYTKQIYLMPFQTSVLVNRITTVLAVEGGTATIQGYSQLSVQGQATHINRPKVAAGTTELPLR